MKTFLRILLILVVLILLAGAAGWWYLFSPNSIPSAEMVPANTVLFANIPNALKVGLAYQSSQLKTLANAPEAQPLIDYASEMIGRKNADLIHAFLPNLTGQSFIAITHVDPDQLGKIGLIAAMRPKQGTRDFKAFVEKVKAAYPDVIKQGTSGQGSVAGVAYDWIQGPGAQDKICVAQYHGWIVTTWGEASLQDWIERFNKQSSTPSLADNPDYQKTIAKVGPEPMLLLYVDYHAFGQFFQKQLAQANPASGNFLAGKFDSLDKLAVNTRIDNGEIVDHFYLGMPHQVQVDSGIGATPCAFETLKFTSLDTRSYWASSINWKQVWKNMQAAPAGTFPASLAAWVQAWAQSENLDLQHNILDPLGSEVSVQCVWSADEPYPSTGLFVKLDKADDFKPTIAAIIDTVHKNYDTTALIRELAVNGQNFSTLKFVAASAFSPTITMDGPYLGVFTKESQAANSFQQDESVTLPHNVDFARQVGGHYDGASQLAFIDSPKFLDRAYQTALPYLSLGAMFNKDLAALVQNNKLPPNLTWLAPMGAWSSVTTCSDDGVVGISASGIGNQGIYFSTLLGGGFNVMQAMGAIPKSLPPLPNQPVPVPVNPAPVDPNAAPAGIPPAPGAPATPPADPSMQTTSPTVPSTNSTAPAPAPASAPAPAPTTNSDVPSIPTTPTPPP